jgi:hypothetical protein
MMLLQLQPAGIHRILAPLAIIYLLLPLPLFPGLFLSHLLRQFITNSLSIQPFQILETHTKSLKKHTAIEKIK